MKLKQIEKLLKASKAKAQLENAKRAVIRTAQERLGAEARALEAQGREALHEVEMTGAEIASYGRHQSFLERAAKVKREEIAELEPLRLKQDGVLRKALQEEIAWKRVAGDAMNIECMEREAREEERREMLTRKG